MEDAEKLKAKGKDVQAAAKVEAAQSIPTPAVMPTIPKVEGTYHREEIDVEIVNRDLIPFPQYWMIDEKKIRAMAKAEPEKEIPGVRIFKRRIQASRTG